MRAVTYYEYGPPDILKIEEVLEPIPKENEVLVKVHAASINFANPALVRGKPFIIRMMTGGLTKPRYPIPGSDLAGTVESIGPNVTEFKLGDEVYGDLSSSGFGTYAEYAAAPVNMLAKKPSNLTFEEAAAVPQSGLVALQGLRKGNIKKDQNVLIVGASAGNRTFAVQIAKSFEAEVTGVCSTRNIDLVCSIGADRVIDYTKEDFVKSRELYDLIFATAGYRSILDYKKALKPNGIYVMAGGTMSQVFQAMTGSLFAIGSGKTLTNLSQHQDKEDLAYMAELIESGEVKPVIDTVYPLDQVPEALKHYETGRARGKIIISIQAGK
ncbi:MAG TPA: NAD(P)-dependent alcohol dehydrogenase [Dehalococcoidia bacterium]|nr:NAD(P)-dependent alcohol dehydrogenase [Dehalococcoidia bacterium]